MNFSKILQTKQSSCKHQNGCIYDAIKQSIKQIKYGAFIALILQIIRSLKSSLKGLKAFKKSLYPNFLSIIIFLVATTLVLRLVKCTMRYIRGRDCKFDSFLAGVAAGYIGTITLQRDYWYMLLMFLASRLVGAFYQSLVQKRYLDPKRSSFHYYIVFALANFIHCYGYFIQPDILKPDMYNLYEKMSVLTNNEKKWHRSSLQYSLRTLKQQNADFFDDTIQKKIDKLTKQIST